MVELDGRCQAAGAVVAAGVPAGQRVDLDPRAAVRSVDEAAVPDVHADVAETVEEDEVAGPQRAARDAPAEIEVGVGAVRQRDAEAVIDEPDESRAVEARARRATAPAVRDADEVARKAHCARSHRLRGPRGAVG